MLTVGPSAENTGTKSRPVKSVVCGILLGKVAEPGLMRRIGSAVGPQKSHWFESSPFRHFTPLSSNWLGHRVFIPKIYGIVLRRGCHLHSTYAVLLLGLSGSRQ